MLISRGVQSCDAASQASWVIETPQVRVTPADRPVCVPLSLLGLAPGISLSSPPTAGLSFFVSPPFLLPLMSSKWTVWLFPPFPCCFISYLPLLDFLVPSCGCTLSTQCPGDGKQGVKLRRWGGGGLGAQFPLCSSFLPFCTCKQLHVTENLSSFSGNRPPLHPHI